MDVTSRFARAVAAPDGTLPVDQALLLVAAHDHPVDVAAGLARLDELAARCEPGRLDSVLSVLFEDEGLVGDEVDYHHPDNSFLDRVLDRRRGLPILLAAVTAEVAARAGVCLAPVAMPGHFLLRDCANPDSFVDPFHGGRHLDVAGCEAIYRRLHPRRTFRVTFLEPVDSKAVVARVITNLVHSYSSRGPVASLAWAVHLRAIVLGGESWKLAARLRERTGDWLLAADAWDALAASGVDADGGAAALAVGARARTN